MNKTIYTFLGHLALGLGVIGVFLPVMPTAPFVILAAAMYSRGSPRFEAWLLSHPVMGPPVRNWREHGAISLFGKIFSSVVLASSALMIYFVLPLPPVAKSILLIILLTVITFILSRPLPKVDD